MWARGSTPGPHVSVSLQPPVYTTQRGYRRGARSISPAPSSIRPNPLSRIGISCPPPVFGRLAPNTRVVVVVPPGSVVVVVRSCWVVVVPAPVVVVPPVVVVVVAMLVMVEVRSSMTNGTSGGIADSDIEHTNSG